MMLTVQDIMTSEVIYVEVPGSRDKALKIMKQKGVTSVPIVKNKKLVGILTRGDIFKNPEEDQIALLMTRNPLSVKPETTINEVARILIEKDIRRVPVVVNSELVGLVTVSDIIYAIADMEIDIPVDEFTDRDIVAVWEMTPTNVVGEIMNLANVDASPVLNSDNLVVGIITESNLLKVSKIEDTIEKADLSAGFDEDAWTWEAVRDTMSLYYGVSRVELPNLPIAEVMIREYQPVYHKTAVSECARRMRRYNVELLPVETAERKLEGIIRDKDLLKVLI
ncbi:MAG TPA: CBS domain-containing protein [Candidatus Acidoferrales bacterium]|nr:CBS domain-containing protein [Candidatus Acidoferrales bacterium]